MEPIGSEDGLHRHPRRIQLVPGDQRPGRYYLGMTL